MEEVFIFGHRNPDTDSVMSSIALSHLKRQLGMKAEARVIGEINDESKYILNKFNVKCPKYLNDVKLQIKDIEYHKNFYINEFSSIEDTYNFMSNNNITGVPIVDNNKKFIGIITAKTILKSILNVDTNKLFTSYNNILKTLSGEEILRCNEEIKGNVKAVSYRSTTFIENISLTNSDILIVGDRHSIIEAAVKQGVKLLIITGDRPIKSEHISIAKNNNVNIIKTPFDTFKTVKKILLSNYIKTLISETRSYTVQENEYYEDFIEKTKHLGFNNYPVVDKNNICKGLIRITEINRKNRKKVILVDHNEFEQSVIGLSEAEILEVIDHHRIGDISTKNPINFRNMAVGSTNTIIYYLYKENRIDIPKTIACLMLSGILSDTLSLTSPTTTDVDKKIVAELELISGLDYKEYSKEMFSASSNLKNKTELDLIKNDIKNFQINNRLFKVGQIISMDTTDLLKRKPDLLNQLNKYKREENVEFIILMITDILKNGSYILYSEGAQDVLENAFNKEFKQGIFLENCVSRKKQIIPYIMESDI